MSDTNKMPDWYASEQAKLSELEGACRLARDLGYATGHADTYADLVEHVREQRDERDARVRREFAALIVARYEANATNGWVEVDLSDIDALASQETP